MVCILSILLHLHLWLCNCRLYSFPTEDYGSKWVISAFRQIQVETGAKLIVQNEDLPACAQEGDELLEIRGRAQSVMQAVQACCALMRINMARSQAKAASAAMGATSIPETSGPIHPGIGMGMPQHMGFHGMHGMGVMGMMGGPPRPAFPMGMSHYGNPALVAASQAAVHGGGMVLLNGSPPGGHMAMRLGMSPAQAGAVMSTGGQNMNQMRSGWPGEGEQKGRVLGWSIT